jgi:hypothetical protein
VNQHAQEQAGFCEFKRFFPSSEWRLRSSKPGEGGRRGIKHVFGNAQQGRGVFRGPTDFISKGLHPIVRCPQCRRRLMMLARYCVGGEFTCWELPDHKPRVTREKSPRRQSRQSGRGK